MARGLIDYTINNFDEYEISFSTRERVLTIAILFQRRFYERTRICITPVINEVKFLHRFGGDIEFTCTFDYIPALLEALKVMVKRYNHFNDERIINNYKHNPLRNYGNELVICLPEDHLVLYINKERKIIHAGKLELIGIIDLLKLGEHNYLHVLTRTPSISFFTFVKLLMKRNERLIKYIIDYINLDEYP